MASVLHSSALPGSFPSSYHLYHLPLSLSLSLSLSYYAAISQFGLALHTLALLVPLVKKILASLTGTTIPPPSFWALASFLFSQTCSQKPVLLTWHIRALQIPPFGLGASWPGAALRGRSRGPSPVARPARIHKSFQLRRWCQCKCVCVCVQMKRRAGREGGKQAVGLWDHFAVTHIPPFCSECLNMKTTQLLLTPALPPKHSSND